MQDLFEVPECLRIPEDHLAQSLAGDTLFTAHLFPEAFGDAGDSLIVLSQQVVDHLVGGDGLGAELVEKFYKGTLARSQRAGDGYRHRPLLGLPMAPGRGYSRSPRSRSLSASKAPVLRPSPTRSGPRSLSRSLSRSRPPRSLSRSR